MGRSKALLDADGQPFLVRVVRSLRDGGCDPVVVVLREGAGPEAEMALALGSRVVVNPDPRAGPISSIRAALDSLGAGIEGIVVLPVDHPGVKSETVASLVQAGREARGRIVLPRMQGRRGHPALFPASVLDELRNPGLEGGARSVVRRSRDRVVEVEVEDPGVLEDIDDPDRYRMIFGVPPGQVRE
ncbi:MAG: nucleotidyltransferase family protein [Gemmatimonadales bacterium]|jgi:CTP:molybdopterin cytidylyltransferase MocA|nr:MAG: nucleotidyltransferase family protein [Gemmatimonadales bacterium]